MIKLRIKVKEIIQSFLGFIHEIKSEKNGYYYKFFMSYLIILIIPLAIGSIVYEKSIKVIEQNAINGKIFMLKQSKSIMDNYLKNIETTVYDISTDYDVTQAMYINQPTNLNSYIDDVLSLRKATKSYNISKTFDSETYLFLKQPDLVVRNAGVDFGIQNFYSNYVSFNNMSYDDWYKKIFQEYHGRDIASSNEVQIVDSQNPHISTISEKLIYMQSVPLGMTYDVSKIKGVVMVMVDAGGIKKLLSDVNSNGQGNTFIVDGKKNRVISANDSNKKMPSLDMSKANDTGYYYQTISGVNSLVIFVKSDYNDWTYVSVLPINSIMGEVTAIKWTIFVIVIVTLMVGTLLAIYLTKKNVKTVHETFISLRKFFNAENLNGESENEYFERNIAGLINTNEELKQNMSNQEMVLKSAFIRQLLKGEISDERDADALLEHFKFDLKGQKFIAINILLRTFEESVDSKSLLENDVNRVIVEKVLDKHIENKIVAHMVDADQVSVILNFDTLDTEAIKIHVKQLIGSIREELVNTYNISVIFASGNIYDRLIDVNFSYNEALKAMRYLKNQSSEEYFIGYDSIAEKQSSYYYPIELQQQLINLARCGNENEVLRLIDVIYEENFVTRNITKQLENQIYYDIRGTIIKIASELDVQVDTTDLINQRFNNKTDKEVFDIFKNAYIRICEGTKEKKKSRNKGLIDKILSYIDSNYQNPDLSISEISRNFNISESYFSQFFKDQTGKKFSEHLEQSRLTLAANLLKNSKLGIEDISKQVGYNSAYSFRRAFKRVYGVLPTEYRE